MPLTKRQFELGVDEALLRRVYLLLSAHPELAYTPDEIQLEIQAEASAADGIDVENALKVLSGMGAVEEREVGEVDYFTFLQEFDIGTWKSAKHIKA